MAKQSSLDDDHHLVRHIRESEIDDQEGKLMAFPQAFALRPNETYLSNGWLEFFDGPTDAQLSGVAAMMSPTRRVKAHHALAIGRVGDIRDACLSFDQKVRILHEPFPENLAYATIRRLKTDEAQLLELLAQEAWSDVRVAKPYVEAIGPWNNWRGHDRGSPGGRGRIYH
jgi:hypothetical protein